MKEVNNYLQLNQQYWDKITGVNYQSDFYDVNSFLNHKNSLHKVDIELLGDLSGKKVLHLQCHFGMDTLSMAQMGANVTGVDISGQSISKAKGLNSKMGLNAKFIQCNVLDVCNFISDEFDIIYTSYGVIYWLPELTKWGHNIKQLLKPGGKFIIVEFHPMVWMFDEDFEQVLYSYFNNEVVVEQTGESYASAQNVEQGKTVSWNHSLGEVFNALIQQGLGIHFFNEYNYSPFNCFKHTCEIEKHSYQIDKLKTKIPMVFALVAGK